jgi:hypothetical protein
MEDRLPPPPAGIYYAMASDVDFDASQVAVSATLILKSKVQIDALREDKPFPVSQNHPARP